MKLVLATFFLEKREKKKKELRQQVTTSHTLNSNALPRRCAQTRRLVHLYHRWRDSRLYDQTPQQK